MKANTLPLLSLLFFISFYGHAQQQKPTNSKLKLNEEPGISQMHSKYNEQNKALPQMDGYRVQIYNGSKQETLKARAKFISVFPSTPVYTVYESPEYKVQTGDFRTRLEAEKFLKQVVSDFGSGFVVKTKIKLPSLSLPAADTTSVE